MPELPVLHAACVTFMIKDNNFSKSFNTSLDIVPAVMSLLRFLNSKTIRFG